MEGRDPDETPLLVLYDGDCSFCCACVETLRKRSSGVRWKPLQDWPEGQMGLSNDQLRSSLHAIRDQSVLHGAAAVAVILAHSGSGGARAAARLMSDRRLAPGAERAYRYVASHRGSLGLLVKLMKSVPSRS